MLTIPEPKHGNTGMKNGNYQTGINSIRIDCIDDLLGTRFILVLRAEIRKRSEKDPITRCWNWSSPCKAVYPQMMVGNHPKTASRLSYLAFRGPVGGLCVLHKCDNPRCVNPKHLFLGTKTMNAADRDSKERQSRGERVNTAKLNEGRVIEARRLARLGWSTRKIFAAIKCSVATESLRCTIRGITWKYLPNATPDKKNTCGENNGASKITAADVTAIKQKRAAGKAVRLIANEFHLSESCIYLICKGDAWRHLGTEVALEDSML